MSLEPHARYIKAARLAGAAEVVVAKVEGGGTIGEIAVLARDWLVNAQADWAALAELTGVPPPSQATRAIVIEILTAQAEVTL